MYTEAAVLTNQYVKCVSQNHREGSQELHPSHVRRAVIRYSAIHHMIPVLDDAIHRQQ
jgi:hypothetical protein